MKDKGATPVRPPPKNLWDKEFPGRSGAERQTTARPHSIPLPEPFQDIGSRKAGKPPPPESLPRFLSGSRPDLMTEMKNFSIKLLYVLENISKWLIQEDHRSDKACNDKKNAKNGPKKHESSNKR